MSDIFEEVEEDVRREHYEALWKQYGHYALAAAVAVIVGVAAWQWYQNYDRTRRMTASDAFQAADALAQAGNYVAAEAAFAKLTQEGTTGYRTVARFRQAEAVLAQGKAEAAATIYRELENAPDTALAASARIRLAWMEVGVAPRVQIEAAVKPLQTPDNPWRFMADEILAYYDLRHGDAVKAVAAYDKLASDAAAPQGVKVRAAAFSEYVHANPGMDFSKSTAPAAPAPAAAPAAAPAKSESSKR